MLSSGGDDRSSSSLSRSKLKSLAVSDMATSPAASLLLSYAAQQQELQANNNGSGRITGVASEGATIDDNNNPSYGFREILAVMRDHGLTGNNIGVLLTYSPNLALRVPLKAFVREGLTDAAETLEKTLKLSLRGLLVGTLGLRRYGARNILPTCPGLLSVRESVSTWIAALS